MGGCCGEPDEKLGQPTNSDPKPKPPIVNQQPGALPPLEKPQFQPPSLGSPPTAYCQTTLNGNNGYENGNGGYGAPPNNTGYSPPPEGWAHTPSPPPTSPYTPSNGHTSMYGAPPGFSNSSMSPPMSPPASQFTPYSSAGTPNLQRPLSVVRAGASPPPAAHMSTPSMAMDEGKMSVAIDFGTTFSGVAYGSSRIDGGRVRQILHWPGSDETFRKIPTCLVYDMYGRVLAWGLEAKNMSPMEGTIRCEWFKLFLEPSALRDPNTIDPRLPQLPPGKKALDLIIDFLGCLWEYAREQITRDIGAVADLNSADVWLTVPAAWDASGCNIMREAAIQAGLVASARAGDKDWRDRLHIITEPEAAAVHCAQLTDVHKLKPSQTFIVCDAGGGTVDLAVYRIIGTLANLEIAEMAARSGANCGSLFLDLRFRELVKTLLEGHPAHLDAPSLANFMHSFSETDKLEYRGKADDDTYFHFTCFNVEDPDDPAVGLENGQLAIPGHVLRREVFAPVVDQVLQLVDNQLRKLDRGVDVLLLVGGFAGSHYLKECVEEQFSSRIRVIARPPDADTATLRGAARYGLARRPLVSSVVAPRSYVMKVKLPAEQEDWMKRPAYITTNSAGVAVCENRLQYLVSKGAILRKGFV
uniref:Actin-like ATPase domain-containing protein n=1 Tax=Schizophyllum commune (strain H4-8 / FGSC 9210) TaxID=578458 RepID=D8QFI8_SCHCM